MMEGREVGLENKVLEGGENGVIWVCRKRRRQASRARQEIHRMTDAERIEKLEELVHQTAQLAALRGLYQHHQAWDSEREYLLRIAELRGELNLY